MERQKKCGKSIVKAIFECVSLAKSQDPLNLVSCFWEIKDTTATCWNEIKERNTPNIKLQQEKVFMNPNKYNFKPVYIRSIRKFKVRNYEEEKELKEIIKGLNKDRTIKKEFKPKIESGVLLVSCNNCGHKQQIRIIATSEYQKFKCENCDYECEMCLKY